MSTFHQYLQQLKTHKAMLKVNFPHLFGSDSDNDSDSDFQSEDDRTTHGEDDDAFTFDSDFSQKGGNTTDSSWGSEGETRAADEPDNDNQSVPRLDDDNYPKTWQEFKDFEKNFSERQKAEFRDHLYQDILKELGGDPVYLGGGATGMAYVLDSSVIRGPRIVKVIDKDHSRDIANEEHILNTVKSNNNGKCVKEILCPVAKIQLNEFFTGMVYNFFAKTNLRDFIKSQSSNNLSLVDALQMCINITGSIEYLHRQGIVHLDIKPDNIVINDAMETQIIDFGYSCMSDKCRVLGTVGYIAPEFQNTRDKFDKALLYRADVYSLGKTFLKLFQVVDKDRFKMELKHFKNVLRRMTSDEPEQRLSTLLIKTVLLRIKESVETRISIDTLEKADTSELQIEDLVRKLRVTNDVISNLI